MLTFSHLRRAVARAFRVAAAVGDTIAEIAEPAPAAAPDPEPAPEPNYVPGNPPVTLSPRAQQMREEGARPRPRAREEIPPPPPLKGSAQARARDARIAAGGEE